MTVLHFTLTIDGLEDESLVVRGFEGQESLSDSHYQSSPCFGFRYRIDLAGRNEKIKPEQVVDLNAELRIYRDGDCVQRVHGIVRQFTQGDIGYHYAYYSLTLVPALERLSLRHPFATTAVFFKTKPRWIWFLFCCKRWGLKNLLLL